MERLLFTVALGMLKVGCFGFRDPLHAD